MALHAAFFVAMIVGWLRGGRPERFAVAVLLFKDLLLGSPSIVWRTSIVWRIGDVYIDSALEDALMLLIFGWLALRSDRWWPFAATAALALTVLVHILTIVTDISWDAAVSARVGLGLLMYAALLGGVAERWLAGELAVSDGATWRRRRRSEA